MIESTKGYSKTETEAESEARAAAFAHNRNYNILYMPFGEDASTTDGLQSKQSNGTADSASRSANRETIEGILNRLSDEDTKIEAESRASGKASIRNFNVNVVVQD